MRVQRESSAAIQNPGALAFELPPQILDRAADGLGWISLIAAVTSVVLTASHHVLQPEFASAWAHPALRITSLAVFLLSVGFIALLKSGRLSKRRLLDLGMIFQVALAFTSGLFESAAYRDPDAIVTGLSGIAVWMMLCGRLMPNAPMKSAITAILCVAMWPFAYWVDLRIFGYQPMPVRRMLVWIIPLAVAGIWMYVLNRRVLSFYIQQQHAEEVGSYTLTSRIGSGGMGEVWRARHKMLARDAAIKLINAEVLSSSTGRQERLLKKRFEREARVTASLRSPHTVALYDFGQSKEGEFYYVMELLEGIDLNSLVTRFGPLDPGRVVHILLQVCKSLDEAHQAGLIHRDIKPRNILLGRQGLEYDFVKVLDFGLVKTIRPEAGDWTAMTMDGVTTGTPAYLSPEVALCNQTIDGRADLYSLGCTAYFLLTGKLVFEASSPMRLAIAHVQAPAPRMTEKTDLPIPDGLEAIVMQLLEKNPSARIQSARELAARLRALPDGHEWSPDRAERWWGTNLPQLATRGNAERFWEELTAETAAV